MLKKLRSRLAEIKGQKHKHFSDFQPLVKKIAKTYACLFPNFTENIKGSHYVYNFGVPEHLPPFTVVKEHGGHECQSPKAAKSVIEAIEDVLDFIEITLGDQANELEGGIPHGDDKEGREGSEVLPDPKIPD